jgi:hypothetical protein
MTRIAHPILAADLMDRVAHEIELCRVLVNSVENAVERLPDPTSLPDLQDIDLLYQTLGDLAYLLRAMAESDVVAPLVFQDVDPLLAPIRLGALRTRLRNPNNAPYHARRDEPVELF